MSGMFDYVSRVTKIYDYRQISVESYLPSFTVDEATLEKDMKRARNRLGKKLEAEIVSGDDIVELTCSSELSRFNRDNLMVRVGKGTFHAEVEKQLIGMRKLESRQLTADGAQITVTVKKITHTELPVLSEAEERELRIECIDRQIEQLINEGEEADMASAMICQKVAQESEFVLEESEIPDGKEKMEGELDAAMEQVLRQVMLDTFKTALIGKYMMEQDGLCLTEEAYDRVKQWVSLSDFKQDKYADYYIKMVDAYVADAFKNALNPERKGDI